MRLPAGYFAPEYEDARERFCRVAAARGAELHSHLLSARGPRGETLAVDCAYLGSPRPQRLLILSAGIHGTEACAGSALLRYFLDRLAAASDTNVILIHALNPWGFAHGRRANENNVDLNRNGLARFPGPPNPDYRELAELLAPCSPPDAYAPLWPGLLRHALRRGRGATVQAITCGQYEFRQGLFYGGGAREASLLIYERVLADARFAAATAVLHLDLHTGLGRYNRYRLITDLPAQADALTWMRRFFDPGFLVSSSRPTAAAYPVSGAIRSVTERALPNARVQGLTLEFGTYGPLRVLHLLRAENRLHHHGEIGSALGRKIKAQLRECFCPGDPRWRADLLEAGASVLTQACAALAAAP